MTTPTTPNLDDLALFALVAEHGGFAAAERATGTPKSRLSRRLAALEAQLGARLIQRSTRRFAVTEVGQQVLRHARAMLDEAAAAQALADEVSGAPRGAVRLACRDAFRRTGLLTKIVPQIEEVLSAGDLPKPEPPPEALGPAFTDPEHQGDDGHRG